MSHTVEIPDQLWNMAAQFGHPPTIIRTWAWMGGVNEVANAGQREDQSVVIDDSETPIIQVQSVETPSIDFGSPFTIRRPNSECGNYSRTYGCGRWLHIGAKAYIRTGENGVREVRCPDCQERESPLWTQS